MRTLLLFLFAVLGLGCQMRPAQKPSVIVVAVDGLDFESVPCLQGGDDAQTGLAQLCHESVRFTHAYTPSVLAQPALASILSGRYPHEHQVRNNGANYLSEKILTVPEVAIQQGYRTAFFSGGPPIWRKSGFAQGFEIFDDAIGTRLGRYYRPVAENFSLLKAWLQRVGRSQPVFAMVYLADLQFPQSVTKSESGVERAQTRESQLRAIDEAFDDLVGQLKASGNWDRTYFVLVGLNGQNRRSSLQQIEALNLFSENAQVAMLIKPARAQRDLGIEWSVDVNVSLVDLGATLFNLLGVTDFSYFERNLNVVSFYSSLERPSVPWHRDRVVLTESDWAVWRGIGTTRSSLRRENWLMIHDAVPQIYNTLVDRYEVNRIRNSSLLPRDIADAFKQTVDRNQLEPWAPPPEDVLQKIHIAKRWFEEKRLPADEVESLLHLVRVRPWDQQVVGWGALHAIQTKNWDLLVDLGEAHLKPVWSYVGRRLRGETLQPPVDPCMSSLFSSMQTVQDDRQRCRDRLFNMYVDWHRADDLNDKRIRASQFLLQFNQREIQKQVAWHNYLNGLPWDTILTLPGEPDLLDLILLLPEYRRPR